MEKILTNIFFDSSYVNYDKFISNKKVVLINKTTFKVTTLTAEDYLKGCRVKSKRV